MEEGVNAKGSYSIWSLMLIMTVLAVWLGIPRQSVNGRTYGAALFFTSHQIAGWILVSKFIWAVTGKRRIVFGILMAVVLVAWLPALLVTVTEPFSGDLFVQNVLARVGVIKAYAAFYDCLDRLFGYGLTG